MAEDTPGVRIGRTLRAVREERLLSRAVLAERSGVSMAAIEHLEYGQSTRPRRATIEKLAGPLGVTVEDLIGGPGGPLAVAPGLQLEGLYAADDATRQAVLDAATTEERTAYVAELDRAIDRAERALIEDAASSAEATDAGEHRAYAGRRTVLRRYIGRLVALRDEATGATATPPPLDEIAELVPHASVGA